MAMADAASWGSKRNPARRLGGMSDALSLAADLGLCTPPVQDDGAQNGSPIAMGPGSADALVRVLRELTTIQRNLVNLQVELQGRQEDERVAHLTHVGEIEKKMQALAKTTATLKDVIQNKDRIIARLQQPYSLDCIPVETEYQKQFSELLIKAAGDYGALSAAMGDLQWSSNFKDPPAVWGELLRPIPAALASCTRYSEALSAMREAVTEMCKLRAGSTLAPLKVGWSSPRPDPRPEPECVTPQWTRETVISEEPSSEDLISRTRRLASQLQPPREEEWRTVTEWYGGSITRSHLTQAMYGTR
ncbi:HAUS augmin-like complex subunit 2 [Marchantia polymorpha subsp. ruderalis]|uniref:AUGMIN subunit 2 n=6 Tax=Marchantia polymorpha TaxID=3197 RepID=A0AAF6BTS7_MARPO|nr:hypothetical protein MARPO_0045s0122 [Marchantia polymorpha]BBN15411.1 hypothetical protein Mp_6g19410 [Marchantia polymorpha subsp. ruderalis]|eukprot:PTQ39473.1 hypothetical protein MARPO_0045s0122 [Marchantia polymorpha]